MKQPKKSMIYLQSTLHSEKGKERFSIRKYLNCCKIFQAVCKFFLYQLNSSQHNHALSDSEGKRLWKTLLEKRS